MHPFPFEHDWVGERVDADPKYSPWSIMQSPSSGLMPVFIA